MRKSTLLRELALAGAATIIACSFTAACHSNQHPDDKAAVYSALGSHDLASVMVDEDRDKGTIRLSGIVGSPDRKDRAQQLAQQAAPGYSIQNQIQVQQIGLTDQPQSSTAPAPGNQAANDNAKPDHHRHK
jgi:hypothetical protein